MSDITPKQLHDALQILSSDRKLLEARCQLSLTDITDSDDNFKRRVDNLTAQIADLTTERDQLNKTIDSLNGEVARMHAARAAGHDGLAEIRRALKKIEINERTIQLALLQLEISNAS